MKKWMFVLVLAAIVAGCAGSSDKSATADKAKKGKAGSTAASSGKADKESTKKKGFFSRMFSGKDKPAKGVKKVDKKKVAKPNKGVKPAAKKDTAKKKVADKPKVVAKPKVAAKPVIKPKAEIENIHVDKASQLLSQLVEKRSLKDQEAQVASRHYTEAGKRLYNSFRYEEAKENFKKALKFDAQNDEARDYLERTMGLLGERIDKVKATAEWLRQEKIVRIQEIKIEMENSLNKAKRLYAANEFAKAKALLDNVVERLRWLPASYTANMGDVAEESRQVLADVNIGLANKTKIEKNSQEQQAKEFAERKFLLEQQAHGKRVNQLLMRVEDYMGTAQYSKAQRLALKVLEIDRTNERARELVRVASDLEYQQLVDKNQGLHADKHRRSIEAVHEASIPWDRVLVYPDDWDRISSREGDDLQESKEEPWALEITKKLSAPVTFNFEQTPIQNVIDFMRIATGVNIILDSNALIDEDTGDVREVPISLQVSDMEAKVALEWILKLSSLKSVMRDQAVFVSNESIVAGDVVLQMYDIRDLTLQLVDHPGPDVSITNGEDGGTVDFEDAEAPEGIDQETIAELIQANVARDSWEGENVSIAMQGGKMIVSQKPHVHKQISEMLGFFRRAKSMQVAMQARFITIQDDFFEELGVSWGDNTGIDGNGVHDGFTDGDGVGTPSGYANADGNEQLSINNVNEGLNTPKSFNTAGGLNLSYSFLNFPKVSFFLKALQKSNKATILSSPKLTLTNTQRGHIMVADQRSYIRDWDAEDGVLDPQIGTYQVGVIFDVRPIVSADKRYITLELRPGVAEELPDSPRTVTTSLFINIGGNDNNTVATVPFSFTIELPQLSIRKIRSTVSIPDGGTLTIGGKMTARANQGKSGVPFLSNLPFVGRLFSDRTSVDENQNLIILVNGRIILFEEFEAQL